MTVAITLWWLFFFTALGLSLGSFLNVVIYRLPAGLDINKPKWSFCPKCKTRIAWYDNLPVISYLRLRGRCRHCRQSISPQYAVVELMTALAVILLLDAFFIGAVRNGLTDQDLNWSMANDWPVFLAHIILFASLLAMSAIDIQYYWVDIRFTHFAVLCGIILHTIWTPHYSRDWPRPYEGTAVATLACFTVFGIIWLIIQFKRPAHEHPPHAEPAPGETAPGEAGMNVDTGAKGMAFVAIPFLLLIAMLFFSAADDLGAGWSPYWTRAAAALAFFFAMIVYEASHVRESDTEIVDAIEAEAPDARHMTLVELATLIPGLIAGGALLYYLMSDNDAAERIVNILHWKPLRSGDWQPLWGLATAVNGFVIAAAIGWTVRILANLLMGKEAFATGDIHMMAAAGCVAGWPVVLLGFVLSCFLAVAGWLMLLPLKKTRAIPLGPWLWIGFLTATVFYDDLLQLQLVANVVQVFDTLMHGISQDPLFRDHPGAL